MSIGSKTLPILLHWLLLKSSISVDRVLQMPPSIFSARCLFKMLRGVPQGSVLSPVLFPMCSIQLTTHCKSNSLAYVLTLCGIPFQTLTSSIVLLSVVPKKELTKNVSVGEAGVKSCGFDEMFLEFLLPEVFVVGTSFIWDRIVQENLTFLSVLKAVQVKIIVLKFL